MPIAVRCTGCGASYQAPETLAGKSVKCRKCGAAIPVAAAAAPSMPAPAQPNMPPVMPGSMPVMPGVAGPMPGYPGAPAYGAGGNWPGATAGFGAPPGAMSSGGQFPGMMMPGAAPMYGMPGAGTPLGMPPPMPPAGAAPPKKKRKATSGETWKRINYGGGALGFGVLALFGGGGTAVMMFSIYRSGLANSTPFVSNIRLLIALAGCGVVVTGLVMLVVAFRRIVYGDDIPS
jgi:hypothetical protein